jgi:hypothetical protein
MAVTHRLRLPKQLHAWTLLLGALALGVLATPVRGQGYVTIGQNFQGMGLAENLRLNNERTTNPDNGSAVGPDHYVEFVKRLYAVYDKQTGALVQNSNGRDFWRNAGIATPILGDVTDPRLIFDHDSRRWFAVAIDLGSPNNVYLAVSNTSNPTQGWKGIQFRGTSRDLTDFPTLGVDRKGVYIGSNDFAGNVTVSLVSIPKADLLLPNPSIARRTTFANMDYQHDRGFTLQPVSNFGPSTGSGIVISSDFSTGRALKRFNVNNPDTAMATLTATTSVTVDQFTNLRQAHQPDGTQNLSTLTDPRITASVYQIGKNIWATHSVDVNGYTGIRWYEIDANTNQLLQQGTISKTHYDYLYPSIAANEFGEVVIGFTATGDATTGLFPSSFAITGTTTDDVTTFGDPILLRAGLDNYHYVGTGSSRWGDYSSTGVDPDDAHTFWTSQEIALGRDATGGLWGTQITQLTFSPIPEPATILLVSLGIVGVLGYRWRPPRKFRG